jgi:3-oxoacyl-[acyl-carrier-protein] synthase II
MTAGYSDSPRAVITGVGVVSPVGVGNDAFWKSLLAGRSGIGPLKGFPHEDLPTKLAAEVLDFDPLKYLRQKKMLKVMPREIQLGVGAASLAMEDARLHRGVFDPDRLGVVYGAGKIASAPQELAAAAGLCNNQGQFDFNMFGAESIAEICPLWLLRQLSNMAACHISIEHDARGPNNTITSREASALLALGEAVNMIQRGVVDCMIVGACGSNVHPLDVARLTLTDSLSREDDPELACRPFDINRDGCIIGEGAAAFIVENYEFARARGAEIYGEILGVAGGCDGNGYLSGGAGLGLVRAIEAALRKARLRPEEVGHINAHGKATKRDDVVEARAYHRALGDIATKVPVVGLKSYFGTFDAGAGAVELAGSLLAIKYGVVPFTVNHDDPDPRCRLNVVHHEPCRLQSRVALSVNRTAMGQSVAAIVRSV